MSTDTNTTTTTTVTFRSFTKADWLLFSGASDIAPGVSPMVAYEKNPSMEVTFVLCGEGIQAFFANEDENFQVFMHAKPSALTSYPLTPDAARAAGWEFVG